MTPIDFNKIPIGRGKERNISDENPSEKGAFKFTFFRRNVAEKRANAAANNLREKQLREEEEEKKRKGIFFARQEIRNIVQEGLSRELNIPSIDRGMKPAIARMAKEDPHEALIMAGDYIERVKAHNDMVLRLPKLIAEERQQVSARKKELNEKPISTFWSEKKVEKDETFRKKVFGGTVNALSKASNIAAKSITAAINATPKKFINELTVDGDGLTTFQPFERISSTRVTYEDLGNKNVIASVNPPRYLDWIHGIVSGFLGLEKAENLLPIGTIEITEARGAIPLGSAVSWRPGRKLRKMRQALRESYESQYSIPDFEPEPDIASLLGDAAEELGK